MAKKKCNWRVRGKRCYLEVYMGSDFMGNPIRYNSSISNINPKTGQPLSDRQRDKAWWDFYHQCESGAASKSGSFTIAAMCEDVMERKIKPHKSPNTVRGYATIIKRIKATCGDVRAAKATPKTIQQWVNYLSEEYVDETAAAKQKEKGLAPKTVRNAYSFLSMCYDTYIAWEMIGKNPCQHIVLPKPQKRAPRSMTMEEVIQFVAALETVPEDKQDYKVACLLALSCGLRASEICGIETDKHVDLDAGTIQIQQSSYYVDGERHTGPTKSSSSEGTVYLPDELIAEIRKLQRIHKEKQLFFGRRWGGASTLVKGAYGDPMYNRNLWIWLNKFLKKQDMRHFSFHDLRHTYISMLHALGGSIVEISHQARHVNKSTTLNVYSHLFQEGSNLKRDNAAKISKTIFPTKSRQKEKRTVETS